MPLLPSYAASFVTKWWPRSFWKHYFPTTAVRKNTSSPIIKRSISNSSGSRKPMNGFHTGRRSSGGVGHTYSTLFQQQNPNAQHNLPPQASMVYGRLSSVGGPMTSRFGYASCLVLALMIWALWQSLGEVYRFASLAAGYGCNCLPEVLDSPISSSSGTNNNKNDFRKRIAIVTYFEPPPVDVDVDGGSNAETLKMEASVARCTRISKQKYAGQHGYMYLDQRNFSANDALPLLGHHEPQIERYQRLRFLIQAMDRYRMIEWFFWIDYLALITDRNSSVEEKLQVFQRMYDEQHKKQRIQQQQQQYATPDIRPPMSMIVATDDFGFHNDGVFLIRNNEIGRRILYTSYLKHKKKSRSKPIEQSNSTQASKDSPLKKQLPSPLTKEQETVLAERGEMVKLIQDDTAILKLPVSHSHLLQNYRHNGLRKSSDMFWNKQKPAWVLNMPGALPRYRTALLRKELHVCPWVL